MLLPCDAAFLETLAAQLPAGRIVSVSEDWLTEPRGTWRGQAGAVVRPVNTAEVARVMRAAQQAGVGVVTRGGGTGLVGGQVYPQGAGPQPLILSLDRMNALRGIWPEENVLIAEAGMTLSAVQEAAAEAGRLFPLSLASEGSATIGGNLATNAGGVAVLRYGTTRDLCLGLEVVMADGQVMNGLKRLRKDNTGYDLRGLMVGSEGTLGVITAASLRLYQPPARQIVAMLAVQSPAAAQSLLSLAEARLAGLVTGFELIAKMGFEFLAEGGFDLTSPFGTIPDWTVLIELGLPAGMDAEETMAMLYAEAEDQALVQDGVIAGSLAQNRALWAIRETIPAANRRIGAISSHDIALPLSEIPGFIDAAQADLARLGPLRVNCFGHLGDGNLHFNSFPPKGDSKADWLHLREDITRIVHDHVAARGGSLSAEHGIGRLKVGELEHYGDPTRLAAMRAIKAVLDPGGILNPGAVLRG